MGHGIRINIKKIKINKKYLLNKKIIKDISKSKNNVNYS